MKIDKITEKSILTMSKHGMSYGQIALLTNISRQRVHQIVKYKKHIIKSFMLWKWEIIIKTK